MRDIEYHCQTSMQYHRSQKIPVKKDRLSLKHFNFANKQPEEQTELISWSVIVSHHSLAMRRPFVSTSTKMNYKFLDAWYVCQQHLQGASETLSNWTKHHPIKHLQHNTCSLRSMELFHIVISLLFHQHKSFNILREEH